MDQQTESRKQQLASRLGTGSPRACGHSKRRDNGAFLNTYYCCYRCDHSVQERCRATSGALCWERPSTTTIFKTSRLMFLKINIKITGKPRKTHRNVVAADNVVVQVVRVGCSSRQALLFSERGSLVPAGACRKVCGRRWFYRNPTIYRRGVFFRLNLNFFFLFFWITNTYSTSSSAVTFETGYVHRWKSQKEYDSKLSVWLTECEEGGTGAAYSSSLACRRTSCCRILVAQFFIDFFSCFPSFFFPS